MAARLPDTDFSLLIRPSKGISRSLQMPQGLHPGSQRGRSCSLLLNRRSRTNSRAMGKRKETCLASGIRQYNRQISRCDIYRSGANKSKKPSYPMGCAQTKIYSSFSILAHPQSVLFLLRQYDYGNPCSYEVHALQLADPRGVMTSFGPQYLARATSVLVLAVLRVLMKINRCLCEIIMNPRHRFQSPLHILNL